MRLTTGLAAYRASKLSKKRKRLPEYCTCECPSVLSPAPLYDSPTDSRTQVEKYGTLEFSRFADLLDVGFNAASTFISGWEKEGKLPNGMEGNVSAPMRKRGQSMRRNSI